MRRLRSWHSGAAGALVCAACLLVAQRAPAAASGKAKLAVRVLNRSEPVLCAEKDNVSILFQSPAVRHFTIEAAHPTYITMLQRDNWDADWTDCDMSKDPVVHAEPKKVRFYDANGVALVGLTYPSFWRKNSVPFRVGDHVENDLHMVQLWLTRDKHSYETLVVYPPDGYFRAHPLPPPQLSWAAYGSSFLVGPIDEQAGRSVVKLTQIAFEPETLTFVLSYADGGSSRMKIAQLDHDRIVLDVEFDKAPDASKPFAALRSMYVTEFNADVARIAVQEPSAKSWREQNIMQFSGARATEVWAGRLVPSRHNTSAPDMVFRDFAP